MFVTIDKTAAQKLNRTFVAVDKTPASKFNRILVCVPVDTMSVIMHIDIAAQLFWEYNKYSRKYS